MDLRHCPAPTQKLVQTLNSIQSYHAMTFKVSIDEALDLVRNLSVLVHMYASVDKIFPQL